MRVTLDGGSDQQRRWVTEAISKSTYPYDALNVDVTFKWAATPPCGNGHALMCTQVTGTIATITIQSEADSPASFPAWSLERISDSYHESIIHELGHVANFVLVTDNSTKTRLASLWWRATTGGRRTGTLSDYEPPETTQEAWDSSIIEAIADTIKISYYQGPIVNAYRSHWHINPQDWTEFISLITPGSGGWVFDPPENCEVLYEWFPSYQFEDRPAAVSFWSWGGLALQARPWNLFARLRETWESDPSLLFHLLHPGWYWDWEASWTVPDALHPAHGVLAQRLLNTSPPWIPPSRFLMFFYNFFVGYEAGLDPGVRRDWQVLDPAQPWTSWITPQTDEERCDWYSERMVKLTWLLPGDRHGIVELMIDGQILDFDLQGWRYESNTEPLWIGDPRRSFFIGHGGAHITARPHPGDHGVPWAAEGVDPTGNGPFYDGVPDDIGAGNTRRHRRYVGGWSNMEYTTDAAEHPTLLEYRREWTDLAITDDGSPPAGGERSSTTTSGGIDTTLVATPEGGPPIDPLSLTTGYAVQAGHSLDTLWLWWRGPHPDRDAEMHDVDGLPITRLKARVRFFPVRAVPSSQEPPYPWPSGDLNAGPPDNGHVRRWKNPRPKGLR